MSSACQFCGAPLAPRKGKPREFCGVRCYKSAYWQRRNARFPELFWARVDKSAECWIWTGGMTTGGYGKVRYFTQHATAHRVAWMLERGPIPDGLFVLHRCDVRACCRPDHLFLGTQKENITDARTKGRMATGSRNGNHTHPENIQYGSKSARSKLTEAQVRDIRTMRAHGHTLKELGKLFGVSLYTIHDITTGATWRHVSGYPVPATSEYQKSL